MVNRTCTNRVQCKRLDFLTLLIDNPIVVDSDKDSEIYSDDEITCDQPLSSQLPTPLEQPSDEPSDDELPDLQDLLWPPSSQATSVVPASEGAGRPGDFEDDVPPSIQHSKGSDTAHSDDSDNDDNNSAKFELRHSQKRKRVRFQSPERTTLCPDANPLSNDASTTKRQRLNPQTDSDDGSDEAGSEDHCEPDTDAEDALLNSVEPKPTAEPDTDAEDALLNSVEPNPTAEPAPGLQHGPSRGQEGESSRERGELQTNMVSSRVTNTDRGPQSPQSADQPTKPSRIPIPTSPPLRRYAVKIANQQIHQSLPAETTVSPLSHPTLSKKGKGAAHLGNNGDRMPIQHASLKVDEIILRPASAGDLFLVATIRTAGHKLQQSCLEPTELLESILGNMGKVESITVKPSASAESWYVIGQLHPRKAPTVERKAMRAPTTTIRERARALCSETVDAADASTDDGTFDDCGSEGGDDHHGDGNYELPVRASRRWDALEEKRLQAWRMENRPWEWIFDQFPDRTEAAVRVRWYMLQRSTRSSR